MISKCRLCGCTEVDSIADAKTLGLEEELQNGVYTCCQIAAWAHEQWLAWFEETKEDAKRGLRLQLVKMGWTCLTNAVRKTISSSSSQLPRPSAITSCRSVVPLTFAAWRS